MKLLKLYLSAALLFAFLSGNSFAQSEAIFEIVNTEVLNLNNYEKDKVDKLKKNNKIIKCQGVKLKNFIKVVKNSNRKLLMPIPNDGIKHLYATEINFVDKSNYSWKGNFIDHEGFALYNCEDGVLTGFVQFENRVFEIRQLKKNKHILLEYDMQLMSNSLDIGVPPPIENPDDPPPGGSGSDLVVVRLLIMYTPAADNDDPDIIQTAVSARNLLNSALDASVPGVDIYVQLVATEQLAFTENQYDILGDKDALIANSNANARRQYHQADIVVLLTNGDYLVYTGTGFGNVLGIAGSKGVDFTNAYAIVEHDAACASYTLAHEVGHLFGGCHQNDTDATFEKGYAFTAGSWPNNQKATIMHTLDLSKTRLLNYSNPDVDYSNVATGVANNYDVARVIENNIDDIANYYQNLDDLNVSISGPSNGNTYTNYTWTANVTGGISPYSYFWEYSINGVDFIGSLGTGQSITTTFPYNGDFTLRVRVTSSDYQVKYDHHNVCLDQGGPINFSSINTQHQLKNDTFTKNNQLAVWQDQSSSLIVYPNPITNDSRISFELSETSDVKLILKDISGRTVMTIVDGNYPNGNYSFKIMNHDIKPGLYFVFLERNQKVLAKKVYVSGF